MCSASSPLATAALRRLTAEFRQLFRDTPDGVEAGPVSSDSFFEWDAYITGPDGTVFQDGIFHAKLKFPTDYPLNPPRMRFISPIFHPNVYPDGRVCISILHPPGNDPTGYESAKERWSPVQGVEKVLLSVMSMIAEPNCDSPANVDAAKMWRSNRTEFAKIARQHVFKSLKLDPEQVEDDFDVKPSLVEQK